MKVFIEKYQLDQNSNLKLYYYVFRVSKAKHENIKKFCGGRDYWFCGMKGENWFSGGFYPDGIIDEYIHGIVIDNQVLILDSITDIKPKRVKGLVTFKQLTK